MECSMNQTTIFCHCKNNLSKRSNNKLLLFYAIDILNVKKVIDLISAAAIMYSLLFHLK